MLALEAIPRDAGDRRHRLAHFVEHLARVRVAPVEAEPLRHLDDDRTGPAAPRPAASSACRPSCTRRSVLVNVPVFSGNADAGRMTSARYAVSVRKMSCTTSISSSASAWRACATSGSDIAGFSPMMYMPRIFPACTASMISTTVSPGFGSSGPPHSASKSLARAGVVDAPVVGKHHRDEAGIARALHVVLAAQRMEARARPSDLSRHQRQRDQAARVVGAVHVLRDAHAPQDHRALRRRVQARDLADRRRRDAAHRRHRLRAVAGDVLLELLVAAGAVVR